MWPKIGFDFLEKFDFVNLQRSDFSFFTINAKSFFPAFLISAIFRVSILTLQSFLDLPNLRFQPFLKYHSCNFHLSTSVLDYSANCCKIEKQTADFPNISLNYQHHGISKGTHRHSVAVFWWQHSSDKYKWSWRQKEPKFLSSWVFTLQAE